MATSFDATARISLDLRSFAQGAQAITKSGGQMEKAFQNLNSVMVKVGHVEADLAAKLRTSLGIYNQMVTVTKNYASAVQQLQKAETSGANGVKLMTTAFAQLKSSLAGVQGLSEKEFARVQRTIALYERMANVIKSLATAQKAMSGVTQNAITAEQKAADSKRKGEEADRRLLQAEQKLELQRQKQAMSVAKAALDEQRLQLQRDKLAQSAARAASEEAKLAASRQRYAQATQTASAATTQHSASTFALRNTLGELESTFQALLSTIMKLPMAFASAAISQEAAFAQTTRVVGDAQAAAAGLLQRFQEIAQNAPISFEEVARIGQLGAQIGISAGELGDFTNTIVKFSLTTGVASEEATLLLGRIAQMEDVPISQMEQLGSAILALGTASAATDQEILRVNASIATVSNLFGLTAQETAGLSAALATLQVRPELSRGALTRVFYELSQAISEGGDSLQKMSTITGVSGKALTELYNNPATRGDFLLTFIEGLNRVIKSGGNVQVALRGLGINAVRDIDVFSRLANNTDIVRESFDRANTAFARGSELERQSKGIYSTTAAELQNLGDAFKTLLATLGGPLADRIGSIADRLSKVVEWVVKLGPIVAVFGTFLAVSTLLGAAWLVYQIALAKTITSLIAAEELQKRLQVSSLKVSTAVQIYKKGLDSLVPVQQVVNRSTAELATTSSALTAALKRSEAGIRTYAAAAASSGAGLSAMSAANVAASRSMMNVGQISGTTVGRFRALTMTGAATALAMTNVAASNRAVALTQSQLANTGRLAASQTAIASTAIQGLNRSTVQTVPVMATMSSSMTRAATAGASLGAGLRGTVNAGTTAATAFTRVGQATTSAGLAARAASFLFSPWGAVLLTVGLLLSPMISKLFNTASAADRLSESAMKATGGTQALANAIEADTVAAANGVKPFRQLSLTKTDMANADRKATESARTEAQERLRAIEMTVGSVSALRKQAKGHGEGAEAARQYVSAIDKEQATIDKATAALETNTAAIGKNVQKWLVDTGQAVIEQSKLADGSKTSAEALDQLSRSGVNLGDILQQSLTNPKTALEQLNKAIADADKTSRQLGGSGGAESGVDAGMVQRAEGAKRLKVALEALRTVIESQDGALTKNNVLNKLLKDALDDTAASAGSASGRIKLTKEALEDLDSSADEAQAAIDELGTGFDKIGNPLTAFQEAAKSAFGKASDAVDKFSLKSKGGLDGYIKQLEKIAKAQRDWSTNLIKIAATLGPEVAAQFRKLGPEAAPAVAELADLSVAELSKLGPRLKEVGANATSDLAAAIIQNSGKIQNASLQTRKTIADLFGNAVDKSKTSADFAEVSNQYARLVTQLNKSKLKIDISADDAKAFKSLNDISLFIDLVSSKKIKTDVAIDIIKAQGDIAKIQGIIKAAEASGSLDPKGKASLEKFLFEAQVSQLAATVRDLSAGGKFDPKGKGKLSDEEYRAKVQSLTEFLASKEGSGLLNPKGKAQLNDKAYRAQMEALANLILGKEAAGEFDANGDGKLSTAEFKALLQALKDAVGRANKGQLDPKGRVTLANVGGFKQQLGGIVQAAYSAGNRIQNALTRSATVSVGYSYYQKNSPPKTAYAATGGWINGPGGPKSDVIPAMLSNGEFVVNAAAASRFGALLEVINSSGGRGFSGVAKRLMEGAERTTPVQVSTNTGNTLMNSGMVQQAAPESVSVNVARLAPTGGGPTTVFNINNQYPQAEATSVTINRSLAYAATISGV